MATKRKSRKPAKKITSPRRKAASRTALLPSPCLWFADEAEDAARFYVSVFKNAKIVTVNRYPAVGEDIHGRKAGSVMTVEFVLNGLPFTALNAGPLFKFSEAVSFQVFCRDQGEIDYYWDRLGEGGDPKARQCGWLKDKFGLSWQVVPTGMADYFGNPASKNTERAFAAMMRMKKIDVAQLEAAFRG